MPDPLPDEDRVRILEVYDEQDEPSYRSTANDDRIDASRSTVSKYVDKHYEDWKAGEWPDGGGDEGEPDPAEYDSPMSASPQDSLREEVVSEATETDTDATAADALTAEPVDDDPDEEPSKESMMEILTGEEAAAGPDYVDMGYGEFVEHFFRERDFGLNSPWINIVAGLADDNAALPDQRQMEELILEGKSGNNNERHARIISQIYWSQAQDFIRAKSQQPQPDSAGLGGWQSAGQQDAQGGQFPSGDATGFSMQPQQPGDPSQMGNQQPMQQQQPSWGADPQMPNQQQGQGQGNQQVEQVKNALNTVQRTQKKIVQQLDSDKSGHESLADSLQEVARAQKILDEINGDDNDELDHVVSQFQQKMQELEYRLQEQQVEDDNGGVDEMGAVLEFAQQEDVEPEDVTVLAQAFGVSNANPEVEKAKWEFQAEDRKAQSRKEMAEAFAEGLGGAIENIADSGVFDFLAGGSDDDGPSEPVHRPDVKRQPREATPSSTRQRYEELVDGGSDDNFATADGGETIGDDELPDSFEEFADPDDGVEDGGDA